MELFWRLWLTCEGVSSSLFCLIAAFELLPQADNKKKNYNREATKKQYFNMVITQLGEGGFGGITKQKKKFQVTT